MFPMGLLVKKLPPFYQPARERSSPQQPLVPSWPSIGDLKPPFFVEMNSLLPLSKRILLSYSSFSPGCKQPSLFFPFL